MEITFHKIDKNLPRREREKNKHRQEIINAAITIFAQKGFQNATVEEVAIHAEFSKGAIYNYFDSKENLMFEIIQHVLTFITIFFQGSLSDQKSFKEELTDLLSNAAKIVYKNFDLCNLLVRHCAEHFISFPNDSKRILQQINDANYKIILKRVRKAIDYGELKDINPDIFVEIIFGFLDSIITFHWNQHTLDDTMENCHQFVDIVFNGVADV